MRYAAFGPIGTRPTRNGSLSSFLPDVSHLPHNVFHLTVTGLYSGR